MTWIMSPRIRTFSHLSLFPPVSLVKVIARNRSLRTGINVHTCSSRQRIHRLLVHHPANRYTLMAQGILNSRVLLFEN